MKRLLVLPLALLFGCSDPVAIYGIVSYDKSPDDTSSSSGDTDGSSGSSSGSSGDSDGSSTGEYQTSSAT